MICLCREGSWCVYFSWGGQHRECRQPQNGERLNGCYDMEKRTNLYRQGITRTETEHIVRQGFMDLPTGRGRRRVGHWRWLLLGSHVRVVAVTTLTSIGNVKLVVVRLEGALQE